MCEVAAYEVAVCDGAAYASSGRDAAGSGSGGSGSEGSGTGSGSYSLATPFIGNEPVRLEAIAVTLVGAGEPATGSTAACDPDPEGEPA